MGTYATIAAHADNGKIVWVEVSHDGYPSHTGNLLLDFYPTQAAAVNLINHGDMRQLKQSITDIQFNYDMFEPHRYGSVDHVGAYIALQKHDFSHNYYLDLDGVWHYFSYNGEMKPLIEMIEPKEQEPTRMQLTKSHLKHSVVLIANVAYAVLYELKLIWKLWVK